MFHLKPKEKQPHASTRTEKYNRIGRIRRAKMPLLCHAVVGWCDFGLRDEPAVLPGDDSIRSSSGRIAAATKKIVDLDICKEISIARFDGQVVHFMWNEFWSWKMILCTEALHSG